MTRPLLVWRYRYGYVIGEVGAYDWSHARKVAVAVFALSGVSVPETDPLLFVWTAARKVLPV